jgi:hypothetical protein
MEQPSIYTKLSPKSLLAPCMHDWVFVTSHPSYFEPGQTPAIKKENKKTNVAPILSMLSKVALYFI